MTLEEKVISIICSNLEKDEKKIKITSNTNLKNDAGIDSFSMIMIINGMEDEFNITINETDYAKLKTVSDIVRNLMEKYPDIEKNIK